MNGKAASWALASLPADSDCLGLRVCCISHRAPFRQAEVSTPGLGQRRPWGPRRWSVVPRLFSLKPRCLNFLGPLL